MNDPFSGVPWDPHAYEVSSGPSGEFRFDGLPAGLYVYEAQKPGFALYRGGFTVAADSPGALIQVELVPEPPVVKVEGKVLGYRASEAVTFDVLGGPYRSDPSHRVLIDTNTGDFTILDMAPGEYRVRATQQNMRGEAKISVGGADVSGAYIALQSPRTVLGAMHSAGGRADAIRLLNPCNVNLSQDWPLMIAGTVYVSKSQQDGRFRLAQQDGGFTYDGVLPGEYHVQFTCFGAYIQSASFGGVDLLRNPVLTIPADAPPPSLEIDYTPGGGALQATFTDAVLPFGAVLLVPDFLAANGPELQKARSKELFGNLPDWNMYQFSNLAPGDYTIYTFPKFEDVEFRNPAFLQALSGGTQAHIEDGEIAQLTITGTTSPPSVRRVPLR
jgi:hypothetical protein